MFRVILLFILCSLAAYSHAQQDTGEAFDYQQDVKELSRLMGVLHGIHFTCNGKGDQFWRERMVLILNEEVRGEPTLKEKLIGSFNAGFDQSRNFYPWCDDMANRARKDVAKQAIGLTTRLAEQNYPEWDWE